MGTKEFSTTMITGMYDHARWGDWKLQGVQRSQLKQKKGSQWDGGGGGECNKNKTRWGRGSEKML